MVHPILNPSSTTAPPAPAPPPPQTGWAFRLPPLQVTVQILLLGAGWAALSWWVQDITTAPGLWKQYSVLLKDWVFRFLLNWSTATLLLVLLPTRWVAVLLVIDLVADGAILSFYAVFRRSLSWLTIAHQTGEGAAVFGVALRLAAPYLAVIIPASLVVVWLHRRWSSHWGKGGAVAPVAGLVWLGVFLGLCLDHKPLDRIKTFETADGIAHSYGFLLTWAAESYYIDHAALADAALALVNQPAERLCAAVPLAQLGEKIAVIQVESLDDALLGFEVKGRKVVPRLTAMRDHGTYLRIQAPKRNGSCDSDFTMLFGGWPSRQAVPYRISGFPFERSIVQGVNDAGLLSSSYHGVNGNFFERRAAYQTMGFSRIVFREEMIASEKLSDPEWALPDSVVFDVATKSRKGAERFFEFVITATSHTPFRFSLAGHKRALFGDSLDVNESYFDTLNYVDQAIGHYVDGLPQDTLVIIYGDHWSGVNNAALGYKSQVIDEFGVVPALLFWKRDGTYAPLFAVDQRLAKSAELRLVDVARWFRRSLDTGFGDSTSSVERRRLASDPHTLTNFPTTPSHAPGRGTAL